MICDAIPMAQALNRASVQVAELKAALTISEADGRAKDGRIVVLEQENAELRRALAERERANDADRDDLAHALAELAGANARADRLANDLENARAATRRARIDVARAQAAQKRLAAERTEQENLRAKAERALAAASARREAAE